MFTEMLLLHPDAEVPSRFAHIESRRRLVQVDMTPCPCGVPFRGHDWVLTVKGEITVLACSRERQPERWSMPDPPGAHIRSVRTKDGREWRSMTADNSMWSDGYGGEAHWDWLVYNRGPLVEEGS